jgi:hypothetical protein
MSATPIGQTAISPGLFGRGLFGGIAAGFLGAGLFGLLFGQGFFGGMAGFEAAAGRSSGSLARRRYRLCDRGDEICAEGQHGRERERTHRRRRRAERGHRIVDLHARAPAIGCSLPSSRLDGRKFVCRAGKWHSPRGGCATSTGSCPSANIEPRYNIALEAVSAASGC